LDGWPQATDDKLCTLNADWTMERNFYNEDFERFLKRSAEDYRMHPAEKVWQAVHRSLHVKRKWYRLGVFFLLLAGGITGSIYNPFNKNLSKQNIEPTAQPAGKNMAVPDFRHSDNTATATLNGSTASVAASIPESDSRSLRPEPGTLAGSNVQDEHIDIPGFPGGTYNQLTTERNRELTGAALLPYAKSNAAMPSLRLENDNAVSTAPIPGLIERPSRFSLQFYFTPNVSYRKLSNNKSYYANTNPFATPYPYLNTSNVDQAVTHKPDIGLEFGVAGRYDISKNLRVRAGLQFNMSRYDIRAFHNTPEVATIALRSGNRVDSFNTVSAYRNLDGNKRTSWLQNMYFQVSAPVGVEMVLGGSKDKIEYGIAGTIQPTYMISDRAYMLSSDYKNYAEVPWLIRRWNANTSIETFVGYSTGTLRWHIGPQVRYQLLSSFVDEYPVKENLFNVGLKVGVSLDK